MLVSAFFWDGNERAVLEACIDGEHDLGTSVFILNELGRVLREKFEVSAGRVAGYIGQLVALAQVVDPDPHLDVIEEDPPDNRILEAALALQGTSSSAETPTSWASSGSRASRSARPRRPCTVDGASATSFLEGLAVAVGWRSA